MKRLFRYPKRLALLLLTLTLLCGCGVKGEDDRGFISYDSLETLRETMGEAVLFPTLSQEEAATTDAMLVHSVSEVYEPDARVGTLEAKWQLEEGGSLWMKVDFAHDADSFGSGIPFAQGDEKRELGGRDLHVREETENGTSTCTAKLLWNGDLYTFTLTSPPDSRGTAEPMEALLGRIPLGGELAPLQSMEEVLPPRQKIVSLASVEQKEGLAQYVYVFADEEEQAALLDMIYGLETAGFVYAAPQPYTPPMGEAVDMEKQLLLRTYLSLRTAEKEYVFQLLTQGEIPYLRVYEMPVFDFSADGAAQLQAFDPPYIQCPAAAVDAAAFEAKIGAMHENTADAARCAEGIRLADMTQSVLSKQHSAQLRFYLEKAFEKAAGESGADYMLELRYADATYRLDPRSGACLREDESGTVYGLLKPAELMRAKLYLNGIL